jgi:HEAT repeat protein
LIDAVLFATLVLAGLSAATVLILVARRAALTRASERRVRDEDTVRPLALALTSGEGEADESGLDEGERQALARLLGRYSELLAGEDRARISALFESRGDVDRAVGELGARRDWVRATAAYKLGDLLSPRAIDPLIRVLSTDSSRDVRAAAARSLGRLGADQAVLPIVHGLAFSRIPRAIAGQALLAIGPAAVAPLRRLLEHGDAEVRASAAELLGLTGGPAEAEAIRPLLRDGSAGVRERAAEAMGRLADEAASAELRGLLRDRVPAVQEAAARALGSIGDHNATAALIGLARSGSFDSARAAARAVAQIDAGAIPEPGADESPHLIEAYDYARALGGAEA